MPKQVEALTKISEAAFIPQSGAITSLSMTFASIRHFLPLSLSLNDQQRGCLRACFMEKEKQGGRERKRDRGRERERGSERMRVKKS